MRALILLISVSCILVNCSKFTCNPAVDCLSSPPKSVVPDPLDCRKYYVCLNNNKPSNSSFSCAAGTYFQVASDGTVGSCSKGNCDRKYCAVKASINCKLNCLYNGDLIGDTNNCATYYECTSNGLLTHLCSAPIPYFNGYGCVSTATECCNFCDPYCYQTGVYQIDDPFDCTKYYICTTPGNATQSLSCNAGYHFDSLQATCVPGSYCLPICGGPATALPTTKAAGTTLPTTTAAVSPSPTTTTAVTPSTTTTAAGTCTCTQNGNFAIGKCIQSYCSCNNGLGEIRYCPALYVFNSNPSYPYCIVTADCPYPN